MTNNEQETSYSAHDMTSAAAGELPEDVRREAEVERLRVECDALAQDAARLDWLSANGYAVRGRGNGKRNLLLWMDTAIVPGYPTSARTAIDAAMQEQGR